MQANHQQSPADKLEVDTAQMANYEQEYGRVSEPKSKQLSRNVSANFMNRNNRMSVPNNLTFDKLKRFNMNSKR